VILSYLTPKEFMARVTTNKDLDSEATFKIALKVHYDEMPTSGNAKAFYESLVKSSGYVRIPGGGY